MLSRSLGELTGISRLDIKQDDLASLVSQVTASVLFVVDPAGDADRRGSVLLGLLAFGVFGIDHRGKGDLGSIGGPGRLANTSRIARHQLRIAAFERQ